MKNATFFLILFSMMSSLAWAGNKAAMVKLLKGEAYVISGREKIKLKVNDWIASGSTVKTSAKSFLKVVFIDKSQMNISASSEVKIERFHQKDAGVIGLVKGKIRSQVSKDYLQIDGKNRSKLFIKTKNSVMGIRGTDFLISTTGKNTVAILFEGSVVFNRLDNVGLTDSSKLDDIVDRGVRMFPGEFSSVGENGPVTIPALLNVQQRENLYKGSMSGKTEKNNAKSRASIVPPGLSDKLVRSRPSIALPENESKKASANPDTFEKDGRVKPLNGSIVLIDEARVIPPGRNVVLDTATNTYVSLDNPLPIGFDGESNGTGDMTKEESEKYAENGKTETKDPYQSPDFNPMGNTPPTDILPVNDVPLPVPGPVTTATETTIETAGNVTKSIPVEPVADATETVDAAGNAVDATVDGVTEGVNESLERLKLKR